MSEEADPSPWREVEYDAAWGPFTTRFAFRPEYDDRHDPAIEAPDRAVVLDLESAYESRERFEAAKSAINAAALRAFVWVAPDEPWLALDWQHPSYAYSPGTLVAAGRGWPTPVFPDGDYYAHMTEDLRCGTFGHPWQRTLTIWGDDLVEALGSELLTWLPRHRHSRG